MASFSLSRLGQLSPNMRGILWLLLGTLLFSGADAIAKLLGQSMNVIQVAFMRYSLSTLIIIPIVLYLGVGCIKTRHPVMHLSRATLAAAAQVLSYYAFTQMRLADVTAILFSRPLFITLMAVIFLREVVGWRHWSATAVGFAGVIIMVRPGQAGMDPAALVAVCSAIVFAATAILVRRYAATERPITYMFYYVTVATVVGAIPAIAVWHDPTPAQWALGFVFGSLGLAAQYCMVRGFMIGEASVIGPMDYARLITATAFGLVLFNEFPDLITWIGAAIIIGATLYIGRLGAKRRGQDKPVS